MSGNSIDSSLWTWGSNYTTNDLIEWELSPGIQVVHTKPLGVPSATSHFPGHALVNGHLNVWAWRIVDPTAGHFYTCHKLACPKDQDVHRGVCSRDGLGRHPTGEATDNSWIIALIAVVVALVLLGLSVLLFRQVNYPMYLKYFCEKKSSVIMAPTARFRVSMTSVSSEDWAVPPGAHSSARQESSPRSLEHGGVPKPLELPRLSSHALALADQSQVLPAGSVHKAPHRCVTVVDTFDLTQSATQPMLPAAGDSTLQLGALSTSSSMPSPRERRVEPARRRNKVTPTEALCTIKPS